jgi:hypothetical protein
MLNPLLEYPISGYIDRRSEPNRLLNLLKSMMKRYLLMFLACLLPALCNAQDLGNCSRRDIPIVEMIKACKSVVADPKYTKQQQARAAVVGGVLNKLNKGSAHESIGLFLLAVDKGDLSGYALIGDIYREGYGSVAQDFEKALAYYSRDTSSSSVRANGLALLTLNGQGVEQNSLKAILFTWMAFTLNESSLMSKRICDVYSEEKYGIHDIVKAHMWCGISVKVEESPTLKALFEENRIKLASRLNQAQLKASNELLEKCMSSKHYSNCDLPLISN